MKARVVDGVFTAGYRTIEGMLWLVGALLLCVALSGAVVALVAIPARREGKDLLTERGEQMLSKVTDRSRDKQRDEASSAS